MEVISTALVSSSLQHKSFNTDRHNVTDVEQPSNFKLAAGAGYFFIFFILEHRSSSMKFFMQLKYECYFLHFIFIPES